MGSRASASTRSCATAAAPELPAVIAARRAREAEIMQRQSEEIRQWWRAGDADHDHRRTYSASPRPARVHSRSIDTMLTPMDRAHRNRSIVMRTRTPRYSDQQLIGRHPRGKPPRSGARPRRMSTARMPMNSGHASILTLWQALRRLAGPRCWPPTWSPWRHGRGRGSRRSLGQGGVLASAGAGRRPARQSPPRFQSYVGALHRPARPAVGTDRAQSARPLDRHRDRVVGAP